MNPTPSCSITPQVPRFQQMKNLEESEYSKKLPAQKKFVANLEKSIETLAKSLEKSNESKSRIVKLLDTFETRFSALQLQTTNMNEKIDTLKNAHDNIAETIELIDEILIYYSTFTSVAPRVEEGIGSNLKTFLAALDSINAALLFFGQHQNFRAADKLGKKLTFLKQKAIGILETEFRKTLESASKRILPDKDKMNEPIELIPDADLEALQTMAKRLSQIGSFNYSKDYRDIRSKVVQNALDMIYPAEDRKLKLKNVVLKQDVKTNPEQKRYYEKGSHKTIFFMKFYLKILSAEAKLKDKMSFNVGSIFAELLEVSFYDFMDQMNYLKNKKGDTKNKIYVMCDVLENMEIFKTQFESLVGTSQKLSLVIAQYIDEVRKFVSFMLGMYVQAINESKVKVADDGLVHQSTSTSFLYLIKLQDYKDTLEEILKTIFFANDKVVEKSPHGHPYMEKYIVKVLEAISGNVKSKKAEYKDLSLGLLFTLNNHQYILKRLNNSEFKELINEKIIKQYTELKKEDESEYLKSCWDKGVEPLKDLTIPYEPSKGAMKSATRELIKKKFKTFFDVFQHVYDTQQKYNIPDIELREHMRNMTKTYVIPHYEAFFKKYGNSDFTTNKGKYIRYDVATINDLFIRLYKTDQEDRE